MSCPLKPKLTVNLLFPGPPYGATGVETAPTWTGNPCYSLRVRQTQWRSQRKDTVGHCPNPILIHNRITRGSAPRPTPCFARSEGPSNTKSCLRLWTNPSISSVNADEKITAETMVSSTCWCRQAREKRAKPTTVLLSYKPAASCGFHYTQLLRIRY